MTSQHIILKRFKVHTPFSLQQFYQTQEGINVLVARYDKLAFYINLQVSFLSLSLIVILPPPFLSSFFFRSSFLISSVKTGISEEQGSVGNQEYPTPWVATEPAATLHGFQNHLLRSMHSQHLMSSEKSALLLSAFGPQHLLQRTVRRYHSQRV